MTTPVAYTEAVALVTTALGVADGAFGEEVLINHAANILTEVDATQYGNLLVVLAEYASSAVKLVADLSGRDVTELHRNIALATAEAIHFTEGDLR